MARCCVLAGLHVLNRIKVLIDYIRYLFSDIRYDMAQIIS